MDSEVRAIVHFQNCNKYGKSIFQSGSIEKLFNLRLNCELVLESIVAQIDEPSTNKRCFHVDGYTQSFKAFIYLNDVLNYCDQPFTVIPKSHKKYKFKIFLNILYNKINNNSITDLSILFSDRKSISFFGKAGTMILSNQLMAHKGYKQTTGKRRYVLIFYLTPKKYYQNRILL